MGQRRLTIGALSRQAGCNIPTIRYYEQIGLLPAPERTENGHRYYRQHDLQRLSFIRRCRDFGFAIDKVRALVGLFENGDRSCAEARDMAQAQLDSVRAKLQELRQLETSLAAFVDECTATCCGGAARECNIIEDLALAAPGISATTAGCCGKEPRAVKPGRQRIERTGKRG